MNYFLPNASIIKDANSSPIRSCASSVAAPTCGVHAIFSLESNLHFNIEKR